MRKMIYLPNHMKDRIRTFREHHEMMEEDIALLRLIDAGLTVEENKIKEAKEEKVEVEKKDPYVKGNSLFYNPWLPWKI